MQPLGLFEKFHVTLKEDCKILNLVPLFGSFSQRGDACVDILSRLRAE